jgi:pimeloyl-ACP methyl ester carboxylesterase
VAMTPPEGAEDRRTVAGADGEQPLVLSRLGSFFFAGRVIRDADGDTYHGDHGYAQYFVPWNSRTLPLVMWHGLGQSGRTWETTPDGRDGFLQIFAKRDWPVYLIDQPRRGRAARGILDETGDASAHIPTMERESSAWTTFRLGVWQPPAPATSFPGVQFPQDEHCIEQLFRQQTPNFGVEPFPDAGQREFLGGAVAQLVDQVGACVLVTHSHSGQYGWVTAMKQPELVRAVVALEPGEFAFPDDELPDDVPTNSELLASFMAPQVVPAAEFQSLTTIPILIVMGDNIAVEPNDDFGIELWRMVRERAKQFVDVVNRRGGDATYLELPEAGIRGNTHFLMADLNNREIAGLVEDFLAARDLDGRDQPHQGPQKGTS